MIILLASRGVAADVNYLHVAGQSLCQGNPPAISTSQIAGNLQTVNGAVWDPLIAASANTYYEWVGLAAANNLNVMGSGRVSLVSLPSMCFGGTDYAAHGGGYVGPPTPPSNLSNSGIYNAFFGTYLPAAKAAAATAGKTLGFDGLLLTDGESNETTTSGYDFAQYLRYYQANMQTSVTGAGVTINNPSGQAPLFISQTNTWYSFSLSTPTFSGAQGVPLGQWAAARDNPGKVFMVGPKYQYPYADSLHMTGTGYHTEGAVTALAIYTVNVLGRQWWPLSPNTQAGGRGITIIGNVITLNMNAPGGGVAFDTTTIPDQGACKGFEFAQTGGNSPVCVGAYVIGQKQIQVVLSVAPTGTAQRVRYAYTASANAGNTGAARGNVRTTSLGVDMDGNPVYSWLVAFDEPVTAGSAGTAAILEDWACGTGATAAPYTDGSSVATTKITCTQAHGFPVGTQVRILGATGSWAPINSRHNVYVMNVISPAATSVYLTNTLHLELGTYCTDLVCAGEKVTVSALGANIATLSARGVSGTTAVSHFPEDSLLGPSNRVSAWSIVSTSATTFAIYNANGGAGIDSSGFGAFTGTLIIERTRGNGDPRAFVEVNNADGGGGYGYPINGNHFQITIPSGVCGSDIIDCSRGYADPLNVKGYGDFATLAVNGLVVSGGVGTATLTSAFACNLTCPGGSSPDPLRAFASGQLIWLFDINEGANWTGLINRPWIMGTISGGNTIIQIPGMGAAGVADGTYTALTTGCLVGGCKSFFLPLPADLYWDMRGTADNSGNTYPADYLQSYVKTTGGAYTALTNRGRILIKWGKNVTEPGANDGVMNIGTYIASAEVPPLETAHLYHLNNMALVTGQWQLQEWNSVPYHIVGDGAARYFVANNGFQPWMASSAWEGNYHNYFDGIFSQYFNGTGTTADLSGQTIEIAPYEWEYVTGEPEEYIQYRTAQYNGSAYDLYFRTIWQIVAPVTYQVRYSTSASLKSGGWSSGGSITTVTNPNDSGNLDMQWTSPSMAQQANIWFGVRPIMPVQGAGPDGSGNVWFSFQRDPNMIIGDLVTTASAACSAGSCTPYNQTGIAITGVLARQTWFKFQPSHIEPWTTPSHLTSIVSNGTANPNTVCTATLDEGHNLFPGLGIDVYGTPSGGPSAGDIHTFYTVSGTPTSSTFTFVCGTTTPSTTFNADFSSSTHMAVISSPAVSIAGSGAGTYASGGSLVSTENNKNFAEIAFTPPSSPPTETGGTLFGGKVLTGGRVIK